MAKKKNLKKRRYQDSRARVRRQSNSIRIVEFLVAVATLSAGIQLDVYPRIYLLVVALLLAYPLVAQGIALYLDRKNKRQQEASRFMVQMDAYIVGVAISALHFTPVPSLALLVMVHANAVTSGGLRPWLMNILFTALGMGSGALVFGTQFLSPDNTPLTVTLLSIIGMGIYVGASSFYAHQQTKFLQLAQNKVADQQKQAVDLSKKLAKYLPPQIWGQLFSGKRDAKLETRRKRLTIFFSDIKGFSNISEELPLSTLTEMLNTYLSEMTRIALRHGGTIDKFIGDAVMVFFGDPKSEGTKQDAFNCVAMAIEMQQRMKLLRQKWRREGITQKLEIRIGINTGVVTVGNFGAESRMDYTILGTDVNLASRLESAARPGHVLVSEATHELVRDRILCRNVGEISVKGFDRPISTYEVVDMRSNAGSAKRFISLETQGFALHMDLQRMRNFDKNRILKSLAVSATGLKRQETVRTDFEAEGFALHINSAELRPREVGKVMEAMGSAARKVQERLVI